jgi:protein gp37
MGKETKINWVTYTWNPWEGCTKCSPGCANCFAHARNKRFGGGKNWGKGAKRRRTSDINWTDPFKWNEAAAYMKTPPRVLCSTLCDLLDPEAPAEWRLAAWEVIALNAGLDWVILTKRPHLWLEMVRADIAQATLLGWNFIRDWLTDWVNGKAPSQVWMGASVENQQWADNRVPQLLQIPAAVHFLSCAPLLDAIQLKPEWLTQLDWVLVGGESGPRARPMHPEYVSYLRRQCEGQVNFYFSQWGSTLRSAPRAVRPLWSKTSASYTGQ